MRYRIGDTPHELGPQVEQTFIGVGVFGILLGIGFVIAGIRGRQLWFIVWGAMLTLASAAYVVVSITGYGYK